MNNIVLMPVFEDQESFEILLVDLKKKISDEFLVVAVDDGSVRHPLSAESFLKAGVAGVVITLKRNLGHQKAIAVGLSYIADKYPDAYCCVMDSDGEDRAESVAQLFKDIIISNFDIIVATRKSRVESMRFKTFYFFYKHVFSVLTGRKISFGNFMALKPSAILRLSAMQELWVHVAASVLISRLRFEERKIARGPRYRGQSKMNFSGLVLHGFRALMVFAEDVLVRVGVMCMMIALLVVLAIIATVALKAANIATPGWFSIALGTLFLVLLQTGMLTLVSLMLSGVVRQNGSVVESYNKLILNIEKTAESV